MGDIQPMRQARSNQFDPDAPPWLHCISRCVRRAFLCGEGLEHRKRWLENRLRLLTECFAIDIAAYAIMSNHLHVVLQARPHLVQDFSDEQVARAYLAIRSNTDPSDPQTAPDPAVVRRYQEQESLIATWRQRLGSVSWFMKALKEPLARKANAEDDCTGAFWEGRFTSVPLLDQAALVACMAYVDLNPLRAGIAQTPEKSPYTSLAARLGQSPATAAIGSPERVQDDGGPQPHISDASGWLLPIAAATTWHERAQGWSLTQYLELVDATGRCIRGDTAGAIDPRLPDMLARLGADLDAQAWVQSVATPQGLRGTALGQLASLSAEAARRGARWIQTRCSLFARRRLSLDGSSA